MEDYKKIRHIFLVERESQRQIARTLGISRNTVAKYCNGNIYPRIRADYHRDASVVMPDVIRFILQCLQEDAFEPNQKQHHAAKRIYARLVTEMRFRGSESHTSAELSEYCVDAARTFMCLCLLPLAMPYRLTGVKRMFTQMALGSSPTFSMPDSVIRQSLLPLPGRRFDTSDTTECRVSQYATVRYASNEYSVRVAMASRNVTVRDNT